MRGRVESFSIKDISVTRWTVGGTALGNPEVFIEKEYEIYLYCFGKFSVGLKLSQKKK